MLAKDFPRGESGLSDHGRRKPMCATAAKTGRSLSPQGACDQAGDRHQRDVPDEFARLSKAKALSSLHHAQRAAAATFMRCAMTGSFATRRDDGGTAPTPPARQANLARSAGAQGHRQRVNQC
jgi:hypothetical protein